MATLVVGRVRWVVSSSVASAKAGREFSDSDVSDSVRSPLHILTSTPHARATSSTSVRRFLSESGIARELEVTVSTIIESEDSDVLGSDTGGDACSTTATEGDEISASPVQAQPFVPQPGPSTAPDPVAGPSTVSVKVKKVTVPVRRSSSRHR